MSWFWTLPLTGPTWPLLLVVPPEQRYGATAFVVSCAKFYECTLPTCGRACICLVLLDQPPISRTRMFRIRCLACWLNGQSKVDVVMKSVLLKAINWYQVAREGRPSPCRFTPSCSQYAKEAVHVHGAGRGTWLTVRRLLRCRPFGPSGYDPVPEPRTHQHDENCPRLTGSSLTGSSRTGLSINPVHPTGRVS